MKTGLAYHRFNCQFSQDHMLRLVTYASQRHVALIDVLRDLVEQHIPHIAETPDAQLVAHTRLLDDDESNPLG